jgi:uncharacterized membrane protein
MALVGRLHPVIVHFPIALVIVAATAEGAAAATGDRRWRTVAVTGHVGGLLVWGADFLRP